jgi:hypothetical protein
LRRRLSWRSTRWLRPKGDEGLHSSAIPKRAGRSCRRSQATRHEPPEHVREYRAERQCRRAAIGFKASRQLEARNALASPAAAPGQRDILWVGTAVLGRL